MVPDLVPMTGGALPMFQSICAPKNKQQFGTFIRIQLSNHWGHHVAHDGPSPVESGALHDSGRTWEPCGGCGVIAPGSNILAVGNDAYTTTLKVEPSNLPLLPCRPSMRSALIG